MSRYGFYEIDNETDALEHIESPEFRGQEYFIGQFKYGQAETLKRFKKELVLLEDEEMTALASNGTLDDVKLCYRVQATCQTEIGFKFILEKEKVDGPKVFPCWVIDTNDFSDKYFVEEDSAKARGMV